MERKLKLAKLILIQSECLRDCDDISNSLVLAEELTKDAVELAKLIHIEAQETLPELFA